MTDSEELVGRLDDLQRGPWVRRGLRAARRLARARNLNPELGDAAVAEVTLLDLAVLTGYLPSDSIRGRAEELRVRAGFKRPAAALPPAPLEDQSMQFALLLDHYRAWCEDPLVQEWVASLSRREEARSPAQTRRVAAGFDRGLTMLADLFGALDDAAFLGVLHAQLLEQLMASGIRERRHVDKRIPAIERGWDEVRRVNDPGEL